MRLTNENTTNETVLDGDAAIYSRREKKTEKEKLKDMNSKDKWQYFKDYYLKICIGIAAILALAVFLVYDVWKNAQISTTTHIAVINYGFDSSVSDRIEEEFGSYLELSENEQVIFDTTYTFTDYDYSSEERFNLYIASGDIHLVIAPYDIFKKYATRGFLMSLTDLPTELYSSLSDNFFTCRTTVSEEEALEDASGPLDIYGIYIDSVYPFNEYTLEGDNRPVIGILANNSDPESSSEFIRYLFNRDEILEELSAGSE